MSHCSYCNREVNKLRAGGLCNSCYHRKWRYGTLERKGRYDTKIERPKRNKSAGKVFSCLSCGTKVKGRYTKGLCHACYQRLRRNGTVEYRRGKTMATECIYCGNKKVVAKDLCITCYKYMRKHGTLVRKVGKCIRCAKKTISSDDGLCALCRGIDARVGKPDLRRKSIEKCSHCGLVNARAKGLCSSCYSSLKRYGHLPKTKRAVRDAKPCQQCGIGGVYAKGLCRSCYGKRRYSKSADTSNRKKG